MGSQTSPAYAAPGNKSKRINELADIQHDEQIEGQSGFTGGRSSKLSFVGTTMRTGTLWACLMLGWVEGYFGAGLTSACSVRAAVAEAAGSVYAELCSEIHKQWAGE